MEKKEIQELIKFVAKSGVSEVEIEKKDFKIIIKAERKQEEQTVILQQPQQVAQPQAAPAPQPQQQAAPAPAPEATAPKEAAGEEDSKYITVKSPMIGTFYRKPSPDKPSFVEVGDKIKEGDVICMIEAMKLFNEIEAEVNGTIAKVLVDDSSPVEYDQPLFLIDPS